MVKNLKATLFFLILACLLSLLVGCYKDERLAKVGKIEIKTSEVEAVVNRLKAEHAGFFERKGFEEEVRKKVFEGLIVGALIENNLDYLGLEIKREEVDAEVEKYKKFYGKKFTETLKKSGFTEKSFRYAAFRSILFRKALQMVEKEIKPVSDKEIKDYYHEHQKDFMVKPQYRIFLAEITSKKDAQKIEKKVKKKVDAYQIALEFNLQPFPGFLDFDTGWKKQTELPGAIVRKIVKLEPGQTAVPFKVNDKWCLVKLIDKKDKGWKPFSETKTYINNLLYQRHKEQAWKELVKKLKKRTKIQIYQKI